MESRLVLVIEGDEQTANDLAAAIRQADYEVVVSPTAASGLDIAIEIKPDCVVCDIDLPDQDGYWVARNIRTHQSPVSVTPFLFLSAYDDAQSRIQGFHVGADVYMTKPFRVDEVVAQVDALVQMASRLRQRRDSLLSIAPEAGYGTVAIEGDLRQMSVATVLSVLGMERRTGVFEVVSKKRRAQVEIAAGYMVQGTIGGTRVGALGAVQVMLGWKVGRFSFTPLPPCDPPPSLRTVQALLLDAAKAEDEAAASTPSLRGFDGRFIASSFGGPPSRPDDTGPPSSRAMREAPVSLAFDLLPSLRPENLPAAEVLAAIDAPLAALELARAQPLSGSRGNVLQSIDDEAISVEIDFDSVDSERMFLHERATMVTAVIRTEAVPVSAPTPPAGTPLPTLRRTPAMAPPAGDPAAQIPPLPAPAATPRPVVVPRPPRPAGRADKAPQRTQPKKG